MSENKRVSKISRKTKETDITVEIDLDGTGKADVKRITGKQGVYYRMRIGDYRIVYALIAGSIVAADAY